MKKLLLFTFLMAPLFSCLAQPAMKYTLVLNNITVDYGGTRTPVDDISTELISHQAKNIDIYSADGNRYYLEARILVRGNRIKLRMQNFLMTDGGKMVKGKYRKYVHDLKVGIRGSYKGNGTESLLIDAEKMKAMNAIYKFELQYSN